MPILTRRRFLQTLLFAAPACGAYARLLEPDWLDVTRTIVRTDRRRMSRPMRILHLSDLHHSSVVPASRIRRAIESGLAENPDLACLTGDFITGPAPDPDELASALRQLSSRVPTFAVFGNHDGGRWLSARGGYADTEVVSRVLRKARIPALTNQNLRFAWGTSHVSLVGLADYWSGTFDPERAFAGESDSIFRIVLSHNPDSKKELAAFPWDLMLSGHTHGGQVVLPLVGAPYAPVEDTRFISGLYAWEGRQLFISRGVGNLHGVRFACRPEVSVLDLVPS